MEIVGKDKLRVHEVVCKKSGNPPDSLSLQFSSRARVIDMMSIHQVTPLFVSASEADKTTMVIGGAKCMVTLKDGAKIYVTETANDFPYRQIAEVQGRVPA